jgi:hypothetical protein
MPTRASTDAGLGHEQRQKCARVSSHVIPIRDNALGECTACGKHRIGSNQRPRHFASLVGCREGACRRRTGSVQSLTHAGGLLIRRPSGVEDGSPVSGGSLRRSVAAALALHHDPRALLRRAPPEQQHDKPVTLSSHLVRTPFQSAEWRMAWGQDASGLADHRRWKESAEIGQFKMVDLMRASVAADVRQGQGSQRSVTEEVALGMACA